MTQSEPDLKTKADRAHTVERLMEAADIKGTLVALEKQWTDSMLATKRNDDEGRRRFYDAIQVLRHIGVHLHTILQNGQMAQKELEALRKAKDPQKHRLAGMFMPGD